MLGLTLQTACDRQGPLSVPLLWPDLAWVLPDSLPVVLAIGDTVDVELFVSIVSGDTVPASSLPAGLLRVDHYTSALSVVSLQVDSASVPFTLRIHSTAPTLDTLAISYIVTLCTAGRPRGCFDALGFPGASVPIEVR